MAGLLPYTIIVILAIIFRVNNITETGSCYIGLARASSIPLLIYDVVINVSTPFISLITDLLDFPFFVADVGITLVSRYAESEDSTSCPTNTWFDQ